MSTASILWSVLFGALGSGYGLYGWKQRAFVPLVCGILLMGVPYLVPNSYIMVPLCLVFSVAPFFVGR